MAIRLELLSERGVGCVLAADLSPREEETLKRVKALDGWAIWIGLQCSMGETEPAVVRQILSERELAIEMELSQPDLASVLIDEALGELRNRSRWSRCLRQSARARWRERF
jgi:hypothetical protein